MTDKTDKTNTYVFGDFLFVSTKTIIQKGVLTNTNENILVKKPAENFPSFSLIESFKKDYQYTKMLFEAHPEHFVDMVEMLEQQNGAIFLIEKIDGEGLQVYLEKKVKLDPQEFLMIAIEMTKSLHFAHLKQVVHRDIKLANFVLNSKGDRVKLIDFGISAMVSRKSPSIPCASPTGTFDYMSPESTGRISKNVDFRSDIYSLGISFYELLTGEKPFTGDLLALVHAHITKKVPPVKSLPNIFNNLIEKMCAKNPSERYKSTLGVLNDLEYIQKNIGSLPKQFQVGKNDIQEFQIPNKLYGRKDELNLLKEQIMKINSGNGSFISGVSGMGKSKLVEELIKDQELKLLMAYGKFDQFDRLTPYSAFISMMKSLVTKVVSESDEIKKKICELLKHELSQELGGVLCSIVPEVEILIGPQKIPEPLNTIKETQERLFESIFGYFRCFSSDKTLVLVIDDLQWADAASFQFLEKLLLMKQKSIFVIGAYRNNEVGENHPLSSILNDSKTISIINLEPLKLTHLNEMVSHTLLTSEEKSMKLSELIHKKTLGNPFFSREFIDTLYQEELITFEKGAWNWDVEQVEKMNFSSNVLDFMIENLKKESKKMQKLLNRAACIGNTFKKDELKLIWDEETSVSIELIEPVKEGWIHQINSNEYQFFHDRLQQASYELFQNEGEKNHLIIGMALFEKYDSRNTVDKNIFKIIHHLNLAKSIYTDKLLLLKLNLLAAKKALENSAFSGSLTFSTNALELLSKNSWESDYILAFETHSVHADACYANSMLKESEEQYQILLEKVEGRIDQLTVYSNYMKMASLSHQYDKAYALFVKTFKMFDLTKDIPFDDEDSVFQWTMDLKKKIDKEVKQIGGMKNILNLKTCNDKEIELMLGLMFASVDVIFMAASASPLMLITDALVALYLCLTEGLTQNASYGLALVGWIYSFFFKETDGYQLTLATEKLFSRDKNRNYNIVAVQFMLGLGYFCGGNLKQGRYHLDTGMKNGVNMGDYLYGSYCMTHLSMSWVINGDNFYSILPKLKKRQNWLLQVKNYLYADFLEIMIQFVSDLAGVSNINPQFSLSTARSEKCLDTFIPTMEGMLHYLKGSYDEALKCFEISEPLVDNEQGLDDYYEMKFYHCLTLTHFYKKTGEQKFFDRIQDYLEEYKVFADIAPSLLGPRFKLMLVYFESTQTTDIMTIANELEEIVETATRFGLPILAAVTSEILLEFCDQNRFQSTVCRMYFHNTLRIWNGLSAKTKVDQFKKKFSKYLGTSHRKPSSINSTFSTTTSTYDSTVSTHSYGNESLDMMSIIKASQALSVELTISNLISKVMSIIIENTGAESAHLFLFESKGEFLESSFQDGKVSLVHKMIQEFQENEIYCSFLFTLAKSLKKTIIISDVQSSEYSDNGYLQREEIKSICVHPIFKGKKYIGTIYLENRTLDGIFDEKRKEILEHVSTQLAISFENAKLYDDVNSLNFAYERFLPKEFLKQIGKGDVRNIKIGDASTKKICILFSDIRSFTNITEKMNPEESFSFVNQILSYLAPIISKHHGFIDKFFGDCIMALFPYNVDDSIKCGYEMQQVLKLYNKECRQGKKPVSIGIGIHYGDVMLGTIGAEERIDATVISDTVNTASRVESLTKTLGANFIVTDAILQNSESSQYSYRYVGKYILKGKEIPMKLFHMLPKDQNEIDVEKFNKGINCFESNQFEESEKIFSSLKDRTSKYLEEISKSYQFYVFNDSWKGEIKIDKDGNLLDLTNDLVVDKTIDELSEEDELKIMQDMIKNGDIKDMLKSWSKIKPRKVRSVVNQYKK